MDRLLEIKDCLKGLNIAELKNSCWEKEAQRQYLRLSVKRMSGALHRDILQQSRFHTTSSPYEDQLRWSFFLLNAILIRRLFLHVSTVEDIRREVKEKNVTFIRLMFSDILGTMKNVEIPALQMSSWKRFSNKDYVWWIFYWRGFVRINESDMYISIQTWTLGLFSLREMRTVVSQDWFVIYIRQKENLCRRIHVETQTYPSSHMEGLASNLSTLDQRQGSFLFRNSMKMGDQLLKWMTKGGYFDLAPTDLADNTRRESSIVLTQMGFSEPVTTKWP